MNKHKYRGRTSAGVDVYGTGVFVDYDGQKYIVANFQFIPVDEVAQLVGFDYNANEVYEGDILVYDHPSSEKLGTTIRYEYKACYAGQAWTKDGCYISSKMFSDQNHVRRVKK